MSVPQCNYFSYTESEAGHYTHYCSASGSPEEVIRVLECARCPKNKNVVVPSGYMSFMYDRGDLGIMRDDYDILWQEMNSRETIGDIYTGKDFYNLVDDSCIINYDGNMSVVYVDDCLSNLGLAHKGLTQGKFMVDGDTWLSLCDEFDIKVEWCNK